MPTAAARLRAVPPTVVNEPPKYTVEPDTATALTVWFMFGFQDLSVPSVPTAAARLRAVPPTVVN